LGIPASKIGQSAQAIWNHLQKHPNDKDFEYITNQEEIETYLIEWNNIHFAQADETPIAGDTWKKILDVKEISDQEFHKFVKDTLKKIYRAPRSTSILGNDK